MLPSFYTTTKEKWLSLNEYDNNALYFCEDTRELFKGSNHYNDGICTVPKYSELPDFTKAADGTLYITEDTRNGYILNSSRDDWKQVIFAPVTNIESIPEGEEDNVVVTAGVLINMEEELVKYIDEQVETNVANFDGGLI